MNHQSSSLLDRDQRQRSLVPPGHLVECRAAIIGVGAIGRQVAIQLAALGIPRLTLIDPDIVQIENLAPQGYWPENLGRSKVEATGALCKRIHPDLNITQVFERYRRSMI